MEFHKPVMVMETLEFLRVKRGGKYIDATLGDGGHTLEILKLGGNVLGIDVNRGSLNRAQKRIAGSGLSDLFVGKLGNFRDIGEITAEAGFSKIDGIIFDLGVSTSQIRDERMGLSFNSEYEPDMRLDDRLSVKAMDLVNGLYEKELADLFREYGEERMAKKFAREIVEARELERISSAKQLADIARKAFPGYEGGRLHPATRIFMALRIAVNDELGNLKSALPRAGELLLPGGRMVVISFHSLEDRIVKEFAQASQPINNGQGGDICPDSIVREVTKKPLVPSAEEVQQNPNARSAKMRVLEKI